MATREQGLVALYIYIGNFKNSQPRWFPWKHGCQRVGLILPIYIYIENFKNLLVWYHWNDFAKTVPLVIATKIVQAIMIHKKNMLPGGGTYFPNMLI